MAARGALPVRLHHVDQASAAERGLTGHPLPKPGAPVAADAAMNRLHAPPAPAGCPPAAAGPRQQVRLDAIGVLVRSGPGSTDCQPSLNRFSFAQACVGHRVADIVLMSAKLPDARPHVGRALEGGR